MSEGLSVEEIGVKKAFEARTGQPFTDKNPERKPVSVGKSEKRTQFEKISFVHGRSMTETPSSKQAVWTGEYSGDTFGARTVKGSEMANPHFELGENGSYDVRVHGLMDDGPLPRLKRASQFLREHGLPTEAVRSVSEVKTIRIKNPATQESTEMPIDRWEKQELERVRTTEPEHYEAFKKYLRETKFIIVERDVQVDERLEDVLYAIDDDKLKEFMAPIFKWLRVATSAKGSGLIEGTPVPEIFDTSKESMKSYFTKYLPQIMGTYLGRLHALGVAHGSAHDQNWSAVGTLYDADSVYGKPIYGNDEKPTEGAFEEDLYLSLSTISRIVRNLNKTSDFKHDDVKKLEEECSRNFALSYIKERDGVTDRRLEFILKTLDLRFKNPDDHTMGIGQIELIHERTRKINSPIR